MDVVIFQPSTSQQQFDQIVESIRDNGSYYRSNFKSVAIPEGLEEAPNTFQHRDHRYPQLRCGEVLTDTARYAVVQGLVELKHPYAEEADKALHGTGWLTCGGNLSVAIFLPDRGVLIERRIGRRHGLMALAEQGEGAHWEYISSMCPEANPWDLDLVPEHPLPKVVDFMAIEASPSIDDPEPYVKEQTWEKAWLVQPVNELGVLTGNEYLVVANKDTVGIRFPKGKTRSFWVWEQVDAGKDLRENFYSIVRNLLVG